MCRARRPAGGVGTGIANRAGFNPFIPDACGLQKFGKEGELGAGCGGCLHVPANMNTATGRVHNRRLVACVLARLYGLFAFTHLVIPPLTLYPIAYAPWRVFM
jgi:hypothetical protein